jgi:hypothetical protein
VLLEIDLEGVHVAINLVNKISWDIVHRVMKEDGTMLKLMDHIQRGMPDSGLELDKTLREYDIFRHDLHMVLQRLHCGTCSPEDQGPDILIHLRYLYT